MANTADFRAILNAALAYPEAHEDHPWGKCAIKVRGKIFVILNRPGEDLSVTLKLPQSNLFALDYPFTERTGHGLGKSGWITARFGTENEAPLDVLLAWLDESYRAIAPKKLSATLPPRR